MYRSHSPGESISVAVVPSPLSSFSPLGYHPRSPASASDFEFACDPPAKKPRVSLAQVPTPTAFPFGDFLQEIAALPSVDATGLSVQTLSPPSTSQQVYSAVAQQTSTASYQLGKFEDADVGSGLPAFLHSSPLNNAMQSALQQGPMQQTLAQSSFNLSSGRTAKKDDYKLIIHQEPEEVFTLHIVILAAT